jgi:hypothetical protein
LFEIIFTINAPSPDKCSVSYWVQPEYGVLMLWFAFKTMAEDSQEVDDI